MRSVFLIMVVWLTLWLVGPVVRAQSQPCAGVGASFQGASCSTVTCCKPYECKETEEVVETGNDQGVLWKRVPAATCYDPSAGLTPQGSVQPSTEPPVIFTPQITIPGSITIGGKEYSVQRGQGILVTGDTIAHWLAVFYRFLVLFLAVAAVTLVTWGGFKRIMAAGSAEGIKQANDVIFQAIIGLVLALISYSLLNLINPALVSFKSLDISPVQRIDFDPGLETEDTEAPELVPSALPDLYAIVGDNIVNPNNHSASADLVLAVKAAAAALKDRGVTLYVTEGVRTIDEQKALIAQNCKNPPGSAICSPKPGRPDTCILQGGKATACPHTAGLAVDVWAGVASAKPISQKKCLEDRVACRRDPAMAELGSAMLAQGFCSLISEPWHFEKPKMSHKCYLSY